MSDWIELLTEPTLQTIYMVVVSTIFATIMGFPLGVVLVVTEKDNLIPMPKINQLLGTVVNVLRSFPFIILMIVLFPLSRIIVGTTIGTTATIVPLAIGAAPLVGRIVESSLKEVDKGVVEAARAMGSTTKEIILKVLIPESMSSLVLGLTLTIISIIGYSAMAGAVGGGGLGDLAIRYGFHRFKTDVLIASVIIMIILVQIVQIAGNALARKLDKNR